MLRAVEQIVHASLSKKTRAQSEKVSTNFGEINTQTEHGYLFHRQVQDPLTANLTAIENILSTRKNTAVDDVFEIL